MTTKQVYLKPVDPQTIIQQIQSTINTIDNALETHQITQALEVFLATERDTLKGILNIHKKYGFPEETE